MGTARQNTGTLEDLGAYFEDVQNTLGQEI